MPNNKQVLVIFLIAVITLIAFGRVGNHGFVNFDDNVYITENHHIQNGITTQGLYWAFTTGHAANWHPLTWISHMLDIQLFGLNPRWHHLMNLLFHITNVMLLFVVLRRMTKTLWQSAFVAVLFAIHPLHVESVAWISERKDVLSTFFWVLTLLAYCNYIDRPRLRSYLAVIAFFALGLMAKPMLVTLPFVLLLLDYWPLERFGTGKSSLAMDKPVDTAFQWALIRPLVLEKIPLFALAALSCAVTYIVQNKGGAFAAAEVLTPGMRMGNVIVSYLIYIIKTIWPDNLALFYPHPGSLPLWQVLGAALFLVAVTFGVIWKAKRSPYLPVGWFWFIGTLAPVIGIVQVGIQAMADRYTYTPSIGLFLMAAWGFPELLKKGRYGKTVLAASSALCLLCLFILTWTQVGYWHDSITLYDHTLNVTENNYTISNNRGRAYQDLGNYKRAIADFDLTIQINPRYAPAYNNRGDAWKSLGDYARAVQDFDSAIEINPAYAEAYNNRGVAYDGMGNYIRALEDFNRAIQTNPLYANAYNNRGVAYNNMGSYTQAIDDFNRTIEIDSKNALAYSNRAAAYMATGDQTHAIEDLNKALQTDPYCGDAYYKRGIFYQNMGKLRQAINDYDKAIGNSTSYKADAFCNRGIAYAGVGSEMNAIEDYGKAIEINPKHATAYFYRGVTYGQLGNQPRAIQDLDMALQINAEYAEAYYLRGFIHALLGNEDQSVRDMETAAKLGYQGAAEFYKYRGID